MTRTVCDCCWVPIEMCKNKGDDMSIKDSGPAFPVPKDYDEQGMTLRDWFAGQAMQAVYTEYCAVAQKIGYGEGWRFDIANEVYKMADAMLKAREVKS